jgi:hypothetical protein
VVPLNVYRKTIVRPRDERTAAKQKKLYSSQCRALSPPREAEQKSFLVLFFKKELLPQ